LAGFCWGSALAAGLPCSDMDNKRMATTTRVLYRRGRTE
jgi:hypothetical protein